MSIWRDYWQFPASFFALHSLQSSPFMTTQSRIPTMPGRFKSTDMRRVKPTPKQVDPFYLTPEYQAWRETVIARAGRRCEDIGLDGKRCTKAEPHHRMFADH
ncbi:MAG TPA: hypothetical protein VGC27_03160, partial [Rhizomicrobium sp.]